MITAHYVLLPQILQAKKICLTDSTRIDDRSESLETELK